MKSPPLRDPPRAALGLQIRRLAMLVVILLLGFGKPLCDLVRYALKSDLYSHVLLIPFVSLYLIWIRRHKPVSVTRPAPLLAMIPFTAGILMLAGYGIGIRSGWHLDESDYLSLTTLSFLSFFFGAGLLVLGSGTLRAFSFPLAFLLFTVPFPAFLREGIEIFFQHTSTLAAHALLSLSGMPVLQEGRTLQLPGFRMEVAQECSGIHSSLVLFITSVLAGHLFLRTRWNRTWLTLAVIPLAILRNGFRIFTIGQLCVRVSPDMINSFIHRRGGPVFFALSLIPFFLLLYYLRWSESRNGAETKSEF